MMDWINHGLASVLTTEWAVPTIVGLMLAGCIVIICTNFIRHHKGMKRALGNRLEVIEPLVAGDDIEAVQTRFHDSIGQVEAAMRAEDGSRALVHAWLEYSETISETENPVRTTARPEDFFLHLGDDTRVLAWWANIFVAIGLTATFLGIIAALTVTTDGLHSAGSDSRGMSNALTGLLHLTAAKFWTSIGGVGVSIILRIFDRVWHSHTLRRLGQLSHAIERGTLFLPPQRIAADQLRELKQQTIAMSEFTTQLAVGIADALGEKMQPLVLGLSGIQSSIDEFKSGSFDQIGKELGTAISQGAGTEMASLAAALTGMTQGIQGVNDRLEGASGEASAQIATAAREFSTASERMTQAFSMLNDRIEGMSDRLTTQAEAAADRAAQGLAEERDAYEVLASGQRDVMRSMGDEMRNASTVATGEMVRAVQEAVRLAMGESSIAMRGALDGFTGATSGIQAAFDTMKGQVAEIGDKLSGGASLAADRNADVLARAADVLAGATTRASAGMGAAIDQAITRSAEESSRAISAAFVSFGERFEASSAGLVDTLRTTAGRMEALSGAIERSTGAAGDHATKLTEAGREAQQVGTMLGRAANDLQGAAGPIREATGTIGTSVGRTQEILKLMEERGVRQESAMQAISTSLEQTSTAAGRAWSDYRDRFEAVDEALAGALDKIKGASSEHADHLNEHVGRIDKALGDAVLRLEGSMLAIQELSGSLEDLLTRMRKA